MREMRSYGIEFWGPRCLKQGDTRIYLALILPPSSKVTAVETAGKLIVLPGRPPPQSSSSFDVLILPGPISKAPSHSYYHSPGYTVHSFRHGGKDVYSSWYRHPYASTGRRYGCQNKHENVCRLRTHFFFLSFPFLFFNFFFSSFPPCDVLSFPTRSPPIVSGRCPPSSAQSRSPCLARTQ